MARKAIKMSLDPKSVASAIKELEQYKRDFVRKTKAFMDSLVDNGVEIARNEVISLGAYELGELLESIGGTAMYTNGKGKGIIFSRGCDHAAFVELGTGVVGSRSPHPTKAWAYDTNEHGDEGWVYFDDKKGGFRWTRGMPSRPFMYNTALELQRRIPQIAKEVFG